ncbi:MAG: hypothetical protein SWY16_01920 [Cyanobacteriota bacterium]|nr:hypothetical protein [Cyanobacteriota bacterium]
MNFTHNARGCHIFSRTDAIENVSIQLLANGKRLWTKTPRAFVEARIFSMDEIYHLDRQVR